jgi:hypothetical protein
MKKRVPSLLAVLTLLGGADIADDAWARGGHGGGHGFHGGHGSHGHHGFPWSRSPTRRGPGLAPQPRCRAPAFPKQDQLAQADGGLRTVKVFQDGSAEVRRSDAERRVGEEVHCGYLMSVTSSPTAAHAAMTSTTPRLSRKSAMKAANATSADSHSKPPSKPCGQST